jgi:cobalamin synthase
MRHKRRNKSTLDTATRNDATTEPYWEPLARRKLGATEIVSIVARHVVPLAGLWLLGGSVENFLLLSVFNIAFTIACIAVVGLAVSTRQINGYVSAADTIGALITLAVVGTGITLLLTVMFGWVIALIASESALGLWNAALGWSVLAIVAAALPDLIRQYREDMAAKLSEEARKKRDQPVVGGQLMCAGLIFVLSGYAADWGRLGVIFMALAITALFIFRDLRPDLMRELTRPRNRPPG